MYEDKLRKVLPRGETTPADLGEGASEDDRAAHEILLLTKFKERNCKLYARMLFLATSDCEEGYSSV